MILYQAILGFNSKFGTSRLIIIIHRPSVVVGDDDHYLRGKRPYEHFFLLWRDPNSILMSEVLIA